MSTGNVSLAYDGSTNSKITSYSIEGLITNEYYAVFVVAIDFNSYSLNSEELVLPVCLAPTHIDSVYFISSTKTSLTLGWTKPEYTGGCPILSYAIYMNEGNPNSIWVETDAIHIRNKPYVTSHTFEGL
jgi:hypothetical protein